MPKLVVAYSDESGNTGLNLFDDRQAWFWTDTLLVRKDLQAAGLLLKEWAQAAGVDELHANVLGFDRIERIADRIRLFLAKQMCWFVFTRIEKRHLAGTKFVDAVLDPGLNDAVHWLHYGAKPLRLLEPSDEAVEGAVERGRRSRQLGFRVTEIRACGNSADFHQTGVSADDPPVGQ